MQVFGYMFFICSLFAMTLSLQVNVDGDTKALDRLQRANEFAVHDAAIPLDIENFSEGKFIFDQVKGTQNYIDSIGNSLNATWNGSEFIPNEDSFFQEPIELLYLEFVDSTHPSCSSFPCNFDVPIVEETESLAGPSVLAIVQSKSPRYFVGEPAPIRKLSIYEYK